MRVLIITGLLLLGATAARAQEPTRYDGDWAVSLACPASNDGAKPFGFDFTATIKDGALHGTHGEAGKPGWLSLDGSVRDDGVANLTANGITGAAAYNVDGTEKGVPYSHPVSGHFAEDRGGGEWITTRVCAFNFIRK